MDGTGDANALQNQQIAMANQQQAVQTIPIMTANGQIVRAQMPAASPMQTGLFGNLGGVVNLGGNMLNVGGLQTLGAVRPGGIIQPIQLQNNAFQQVQQYPNIVQIPVSANGQTGYMPIQMQQLQTVQDMSQVSNAVSIAQTAATSSIVAGSLQQATQIAQLIDQSTSKQQTISVSKSSSGAKHTPIILSHTGQVTSAGTSQNVAMQGQTIAAAAAAANIIPQMQLIPVGNGSYMQAAVYPSQSSMPAGQNMITIASLTQNSSTATTTTNATNTVATPQLSNSQQQPIIQTVSGQQMQNIQLGANGQLIASPGQVINLSNLKNGQYPFQLQNMQGIQTLQGLQGFQNLTQVQTVNGQQQQIVGTPVSSLQGIQTVTLNAQGNLTAVPTMNNQIQQLATVNMNGQQSIHGLQQIQQGLPQILSGEIRFRFLKDLSNF